MLWLAQVLQTTGRRVLDQPCRSYATRIGKLGKLPEKVDLPGVKAAVAVASGKGGVGKSTTTGAPRGIKQAKTSTVRATEGPTNNLSVQPISLLPWLRIPA